MGKLPRKREERQGRRGNLQREGECSLLEVMFAALTMMVESLEYRTSSNDTLHACAV